MDAVVLGNVTLDIICWPVEDVPRYDSLSFERVKVSPGGCGSNVAIGLRALGVDTALICRLGNDDPAILIEQTWRRVGIDLRFLVRDANCNSAVSVGLVDKQAQPRFVHTPGANAGLTVDDVDIPRLASDGARALHIAGYFVLPGLMDGRLPDTLRQARQHDLITSLDVVNSFRIRQPESLWPCLPQLDVFLCNRVEAERLTGQSNPERAAHDLLAKGAHAVVVKLGDQGCFLLDEQGGRRIPALPAQVVDTTGAGDAFAAGLMAGLLAGESLEGACQRGHRAGARIVTSLGAVGGWLD